VSPFVTYVNWLESFKPDFCSEQKRHGTTIIFTATISLLVFGIIGIIDGFYYHLWKFNLYKHPETRFEHITHTIRSAAFLALLFLLFLEDYGGPLLLLGVGVVILDIFVVAIDMIFEGDSRRNLGGLPHKAYVVHVIANTLHFISIALILVAKPLNYWAMDAPKYVDRDYPAFTQNCSSEFDSGCSPAFASSYSANE